MYENITMTGVDLPLHTTNLMQPSLQEPLPATKPLLEHLNVQKQKNQTTAYEGHLERRKRIFYELLVFLAAEVLSCLERQWQGIIEYVNYDMRDW